MTKPVKPTAPPVADRSERSTFSDRVAAQLTYLSGALPDYVSDSNDFVELASTAAETAKTDTIALKADTQGIRDATFVLKTEAESARDAALALSQFAGPWSALTGAFGVPSSTFHGDKFWTLLEPVADVTAHEPGVSPKWLEYDMSIHRFGYGDRGDLRGIEGDNAAMVDGLGLFFWVEGSDEPDDDETCFVTATGAWLLEAISWDVAFAYWLADHDAQEASIEDIEAKFITTTANQTITSLAAITAINWIIPANGAAIGDRVIANPPGQIETLTQGRVSYYAWVSAANQVTVRFVNASAAAATLATGTWNIQIIK